MVEPHESWSDNQLLLAAMRGDNKAFVVFCSRVLPVLHLHVSQLCSSYRLDRSLVEDFSNDTLVRVLDHIKGQPKSASSDPNPIRNAEAWIKTIATHIVIDFVRKVARLKERPINDLPEDSPAPGSDLTLGEIERLEALFDTLSLREREVTELLYIDGLTVDEAAKQLGISHDAVRKANQRALRRLKEKLQGG
jgi:RNA polymerase sigma factor (sigma-70 family)